jgi:glucose-1-phosphate thymidylyltransferase
MERQWVGLIPAAGQAKRVSPLPGSKELFPIGFREVAIEGHVEIRPKVISQYLIDNMLRAGAGKIWMVLSKGKTDIMQYYGDGAGFGGHFAYLIMDRMWGMPYTLDQAWPWINHSYVLFGMPDTIFTPEDSFSKLVHAHDLTGADVTLGIFSTEHPEKLCPVLLDDSGRVLDMTDKPVKPTLRNTWGCACWSPSFTDFMHEYLCGLGQPGSEVVLADVFRAAIKADLNVRGVSFENGEYIDVGTPEDLVVAVHRFSKR